MIKKTVLSAIQLEAIERFRIENNCQLMLCNFPSFVNFRNKLSGDVITKTLGELVHYHLVAKEEEKNARNHEKKRQERENKWKPKQY